MAIILHTLYSPLKRVSVYLTPFAWEQLLKETMHTSEFIPSGKKEDLSNNTGPRKSILLTFDRPGIHDTIGELQIFEKQNNLPAGQETEMRAGFERLISGIPVDNEHPFAPVFQKAGAVECLLYRVVEYRSVHEIRAEDLKSVGVGVQS